MQLRCLKGWTKFAVEICSNDDNDIQANQELFCSRGRKVSGAKLVEKKVIRILVHCTVS